MSPFWGIIIGLAVVGVLFKLFRKTMLYVLSVVFVVLAVVVMWPQSLVVLADFAVRIRELIGLK